MGNESQEKSVQLPQSVSSPEGSPPAFSAGKSYLTTVAHELKTPVAIICGYIEILLEGDLGPLNAEQKQVLADALANCTRLKKFVGEFLSHAALETAKARLYLERGDLNQCLADVCCYWRQQVQAKGVALYFNPAADMDPFWFDHDKVQQIVSNLLDNALKFTPSGGTIWVATYGARLDTLAAGDAESAGVESAGAGSVPAVKIVVADTGPGIPAEFYTEVFTEFFRISNQKGNPNGTGLGLSIAKRLTQMHGGRIWIECEPGAGTRISFLIPMRREEREAECQEMDRL